MQACLDAFVRCAGDVTTTVEQRDKARAWAMAAAQGRRRPDQLWDAVDPEHPELSALRAFLRTLCLD